MIIDFHTHCFPDTLAPKAMKKLGDTCNIPYFTDGTVKDNLRLMKECGVDKAVVCNIATNPKQTVNVNNFAIMINNVYPEIISFGSVHPDNDPKEIASELKRLKAAGLKGIKIHPDYMYKHITDDAYKVIFAACCDLNLVVLTHSGFDYLSPDLSHCTPEGIVKVINEFRSLKLVAAHVGGARMEDDTIKHLLGKNVWFDLSTMVTENMDKKIAYKILTEHDPYKLLFASDMPWCSPKDEIDYINSLGLSEDLLDRIYYKNALRLLS
jgi:Predicted metal-dependent hydrolase of the TIM-barrel fold